MRKVLFSEQQRQRMRDMYEKNEASLAVIARNFGVSVPLIAGHLREMGVKIRPKGRRPTQKNGTTEPKAPAVIAPEPDSTPIFDWI